MALLDFLGLNIWANHYMCFPHTARNSLQVRKLSSSSTPSRPTLILGCTRNHCPAMNTTRQHLLTLERCLVFIITGKRAFHFGGHVGGSLEKFSGHDASEKDWAWKCTACWLPSRVLWAREVV